MKLDQRHSHGHDSGVARRHWRAGALIPQLRGLWQERRAIVHISRGGIGAQLFEMWSMKRMLAVTALQRLLTSMHHIVFWSEW